MYEITQTFPYTNVLFYAEMHQQNYTDDNKVA